MIYNPYSLLNSKLSQKKIDPIIECKSESVNFFSILNEKNNCK